MSNRGNDFSNLLDQLRERHAAVYWMVVVLMAFSVVGILCVFNIIFRGPPAGIPR